jgi:hypothetical protein
VVEANRRKFNDDGLVVLLLVYDIMYVDPRGKTLRASVVEKTVVMQQRVERLTVAVRLKLLACSFL